MTRLLKVVPTTLLLVLAVTSPAYATFSEWLDKLGELSGPGPFKNKFVGSAVAADFLCYEARSWGNRPAGSNQPALKALKEEVLRVLDNPKDPFVISSALQQFLLQKNPAPPGATVQQQGVPAPVLGPRDRLIALFRMNEQYVQVAQEAARQLIWDLREEMIASTAQGAEAKFVDALTLQGIQPDSVGAMTRRQIEATIRVVFSPLCSGDLRLSRYSFGLYAAWLTSERFPDSYDFADDIKSKSSTITAVPVAFTARMSLPGVTRLDVLRAWDVGASIGAIGFSGERFDTFWLPYGEFPRFTFRPLAHIACESKNRCPDNWTWWDVLEVEALAKWIPGIDADQFGARSGPSSGQHVQWWLRVGGSYKFVRNRMPAKIAGLE